MSEQAREVGTGGRAIVAVMAAVAIAVVAYFVVGMPGMDHGSGGMAAMSPMASSEMALAVDEFAFRMSSSQAFVVNVDMPGTGTIDGTDAAIPYDVIVGDRRLPADKDTPILLYCKTGRKSRESAKMLMDEGYAGVVYLKGGTDAWVRAGRSAK